VPLVSQEGEDFAAACDRAFAALSARVAHALGREPGGLSVAVSLLPPHADVRLVALPPLRRAEAEAVIRRDAARHFVGGNGVRIVAVRMPPAVARRQTDGSPVLAAAASSHVAEAVRASARRVGWTVTRITAAHAAWIAAAERAAKRSSAGAPLAAIAIVDDTAHVLKLERGAVTLLRRIRADDAREIARALGTGPGAASIFTDGAADAIARGLTDSGWTIVRGQSAAQVAATGAHDAGLELVPVSVLAEQEGRWRTLAAQLAAAAVLLIVGAAVVQLWGAQRELAAVRTQRAALRPQVAPLLETRDSLDRLPQRADELGSLDTSAKWTRALFDVALLLPHDAYLTSLRGTGDTLVVSGQGARAGAALQALRGAESLTNVRLDGPIERDLEDGTTTLERFTLTARIAGDSTARRPE
jgi:Tfp pilus assembly protein PilN